MVKILSEAVEGKEIYLTSLRRSDIKWLMMELFDKGINFKVIGGILKREY